ncbi:MAG: ABC transporter permease [Haloarculaceae archaeon]
MSRTAALVGALWRDWIRNRESVFFSLLFPVVLLLIFSTVFAGGSPEFTVHVQNRDLGPDGAPTNVSAAYVETLNETEPITVRRLDPDRNVTAWSQSGDALGSARVVVIPDGFAAGVRERSREVRVAVIRDTVARAGNSVNDSQRRAIRQGLGGMSAGNGTGPTNASDATEIRYLSSADDDAASVVRGILASHLASFNAEAIGMDDPPASIRGVDLRTRTLSSVDYYLPAFIAAIVLLNGVVTVTSVVAGFNQNGTLKRLAATPLRKRDWILGTLVHQSVLALVLTGVMLLVARVVFAVTVIPGPLALALILLGAVGFTGVGMALGGTLANQDAAIALGNAIAFPMMFLSGVFWEVDLMPASLQFVARLMPLYHFHRGLRQLMVLDTTEGVLVPFAVLGALAVVFVGVAIHTTRWKDFGD